MTRWVRVELLIPPNAMRLAHGLPVIHTSLWRLTTTLSAVRSGCARNPECEGWRAGGPLLPRPAHDTGEEPM